MKQQEEIKTANPLHSAISLGVVVHPCTPSKCNSIDVVASMFAKGRSP
jgi:hypothetical protein